MTQNAVSDHHRFTPADMLDAQIMGNEGTMYALFDHLRANDPICWVEHPQQMAMWRDNPDMDISAAKELIRWTSPVRHMVRTATQDFELHGKQIKAGDNIALWYPAANRDPDAFESPNTLDLTRDPKQQLAFGYGSHMCLGQHLAAMEVACFFRELLPRLDNISANGQADWIHAIFVGGLKSLPVSYTFKS